MGRHKKNIHQFRNDLMKKYGDEILYDFWKLRNVYKYNTVRIANKYNFTRAYASRVFNILYGINYRVIQNHKREKFENSISDLDRYLYHKDGKLRERAHKILRVLNRCKEHNCKFRVERKNGRFNFTINGKPVAIRTAYVSNKSLERAKTEYFHIDTENVYTCVKFIVCYIVPHDVFYIAPYEYGRSYYFPNLLRGIKPGNNFRNPNDKYKEAWNLLK